MRYKRSLRFFNRPESLAYLEILLEALVIVVVFTELSLECTAYLFPEWHRTATVPRAKTGFISSILGYGQKRDSQSQSFLLPSSIEHTNNRKLLSIGCMVLISAAGALYLMFTLFLWTNRDWKPPVLDDSPDQCTKRTRVREITTVLLWLVSGPQVVVVALMVMGHVGWSAVPVPLWPDIWSFYGFIALFLGLVMWLPTILFITADIRLFSRTEGSTYQWKSWKCWLMSLLETGLLIANCGALALAPAVPALIWADMLRCVVVIFGIAAGFPGCVVLSCLLMMYTTGRMLGFWMTGSNIAWIAGMTALITGRKGYFEQIFPSKFSNGNIVADVSDEPVKRRLRLVLHWMTICILSNAAWSSYVGGTTQSFRSLEVLNWIVDATLPKCMSTIMVQLFSGEEDGNTACIYLNYTLSGLETHMGNVGYFITGGLAHLSTITLYLSVNGMYAYVLIAGIVVAVKNCRGREKPVPRTVYEQVSLNNLDKWSAAMAIVPLCLTKLVLAVYALDFVLPERFYLPGVTACLLCYTVAFSWGCVKEIFAWLKILLTHRHFGYHRGEERLIETDNNMGMKSGNHPKTTSNDDDDRNLMA